MLRLFPCCSGLNPRNYDRFIMYLPTPANCGVVGWGTVGCTHGTSCSVWIYKTSVSLALHETSHNFGLNHANAVGFRTRKEVTTQRSLAGHNATA